MAREFIAVILCSFSNHVPIFFHRKITRNKERAKEVFNLREIDSLKKIWKFQAGRNFSHTHTHTQRVRWENCRYSKLFILPIHFLCFRFCRLCSKQVSDGHCLWRKQHHDAIHFTRHLETVCSTACHSPRKVQYEDFRMSGRQCEDSPEDSERVWRVQWWLGRNSSSDRSDKERTHKFIDEIQDHDRQRSQQINQVHGSIWVSYQAGNARRHLRYKYKMRKGQFSSQAMKDQKNDCAAKLLNKLK